MARAMRGHSTAPAQTLSAGSIAGGGFPPIKAHIERNPIWSGEAVPSSGSRAVISAR